MSLYRSNAECVEDQGPKLAEIRKQKEVLRQSPDPDTKALITVSRFQKNMGDIGGVHHYSWDLFPQAIDKRTVLLLGYGITTLAWQAAQRQDPYRSQPTVTTADISEVFEAEERRIEPAGHPDTQVPLQRFESLPFRDETFDLVFASPVFPAHARTSEQVIGFLDEALRVVAPGGRLSMSDVGIKKGNNLQTKEVIQADFYDAVERRVTDEGIIVVETFRLGTANQDQLLVLGKQE